MSLATIRGTQIQSCLNRNRMKLTDFPGWYDSNYLLYEILLKIFSTKSILLS